MRAMHLKNGRNITMPTRKFEELTHQEKCEIYNMSISGQYYNKEIQQKFCINDYTHRRVVNAVKDFLRTGVPQDL